MSVVFAQKCCPVCGENEFRTILEITPDQFLSDYRKNYYDLSVIGIDMDSKFFFQKCKKCQFVMVNPRLRSDLYNIVYNEAKVGQNKCKGWAFDKGDLGCLYKTHHKWRVTFPFLRVLSFYEEFFKKPKNDNYKQLRLLDYGCGYGHTLELCKVFGIDAVGVDIDEFRLNHCKDRCLKVFR